MRKREKVARNKGNDECLINLLKWLKQHQTAKQVRLRPALFPTTGRGLQALQHIRKDSTLVKIPIECCVTRHYLKTCWLGSLLGLQFDKFTTQEIMSAWLALMTQQQDSEADENLFWKPYLQSLPAEYSLPLTCSRAEVCCMPGYIRDKIEAQKEQVDKSFEKLRFHFPHLDKQRFLWGFCTVNSRAVYLQKDPRDAGPGEAGEDCLALVPFLDLLNHSDDVSVEAGINLDRERVEGTPAGHFYEIRVNQRIRKYQEAFICYGKHSNTKLLLEYGFFLGDLNSNEHVPVTLQDILDYVKEANLQVCCLSRKLEILRTNDLVSNLGIGRQGLSWNVQATLHILVLNQQNLHSWSTVFRMEHFDHLNKLFQDFLAKFLARLRTHVKEMSLVSDQTKYFCLAVDLVKYHVELISSVYSQICNVSEI